jgi:hypothetical protein
VVVHHGAVGEKTIVYNLLRAVVQADMMIRGGYGEISEAAFATESPGAD